MKNDFNFCPECGSKNIQNLNNKKWRCPDCDFTLYPNVAAAVGVFIYDDDKNFIFEVRAKNPQKGMLSQPGGFVDSDEAAEDAVRRECMEELGVEVTDIKYLCTCPNDYEYKEIAYKTCDMFFTAKLSGSKKIEEFIKEIHAQESEVQNIQVCKIQKSDDIEKYPFAFKSTKNALKKLFQGNLC